MILLPLPSSVLSPALALGAYIPSPPTSSSGQEQGCVSTVLPNEDSHGSTVVQALATQVRFGLLS